MKFKRKIKSKSKIQKKLEIDDFQNTKKLLNELSKDILPEIKSKLIDSGKGDSNLINLININFSWNNTKFSLSLQMPYYGIYVDAGRKGNIDPTKWYANDANNRPWRLKRKVGDVLAPPVKPIEEWMKRKGIPEQYLYPIRMKIKEKGIEPTNFLDPWGTSVELIKEHLIDSIRKDVIAHFTAFPFQIQPKNN